MEEEHEPLTITEVATILGVTGRFVSKLVANEQLKAANSSGVMIFTLDAVNDFLKSVGLKTPLGVFDEKMLSVYDIIKILDISYGLGRTLFMEQGWNIVNVSQSYRRVASSEFYAWMESIGIPPNDSKTFTPREFCEMLKMATGTAQTHLAGSRAVVKIGGAKKIVDAYTPDHITVNGIPARLSSLIGEKICKAADYAKKIGKDQQTVYLNIKFGKLKAVHIFNSLWRVIDED